MKCFIMVTTSHFLILIQIQKLGMFNGTSVSSLRYHFKPISGIAKYHHLNIDSDSHVVTARIFTDSPKVIVYEFEPYFDIQYIVFKKIVPTGFTNERAWYLYNQTSSSTLRRGPVMGGTHWSMLGRAPPGVWWSRSEIPFYGSTH